MSIPAPGLTVKDIETDGEMSVYGTAEHRGALVLSVEENSPAGRLGILPEDVIVCWHGREINRAADLTDPDAASEAPSPFRVLRRQKPLEL